jgi:hypothetical protein
MFVIVYHIFGEVVSYTPTCVGFLDAPVSVRPNSRRP